MRRTALARSTSASAVASQLLAYGFAYAHPPARRLRRFLWRSLLALALIPCAAAPAAHAPAFSANGDETLANLIAEALERNRAIRSAEWQERAAREGIAAATALPDPSLQVTGFPRGPETRVGPQIAGIAVTQRLPWFGKLTDEGEALARQAELRGALVNVLRADTVKQVKVAYYEAAYLARAIRIASEEAESLRHYESLARARYAQGVGLQRDVLRIQAEITRVQGRLQELEAERRGVAANLNALRHQPIERPLPTVTPGVRPTAKLNGGALRASARSFAPEAGVTAAKLAQETARLRLAEQRHLPDLALAAGWGLVGSRRDEVGRLNPPPGNGEDTFHVSVGVSIPLQRAKYDAGRRRVGANRAAAEEAHRSALANVDAGVRAIVSRIKALGERIVLAEGTLLPQAEAALGSTEEAYATGAVGVLELLDDERMLLDVHLAIAGLEADYMKALANMERIIGTPFPVAGGSDP